MQLYTDYQCLAKAGVTGSYYRVTKAGNPDKRYKLAKEMESRYGEGLARVRQEKLKNSRGIAESRKRKNKKPSIFERVAGFFKLFICLSPFILMITERLS